MSHGTKDREFIKAAYASPASVASRKAENAKHMDTDRCPLAAFLAEHVKKLHKLRGV